MASTESKNRIKRRRESAARGVPAPREARARAEATPATPPVIEFRGVSKRYSGGDVGLDRVTFSIERGEFVFLVGATGSGKSTVMHLLIKEIDPTDGRIL